MPSTAKYLLALALGFGLAASAQGQQRRTYPDARNYQPSAQRTNPSTVRSQYEPRQQQPPQQRVAARPRPGQDQGPNIDLPRGEGIVKQEVLATIVSQVVLGGLNNPRAVAIQPKSGEVFVAEAGLGRIGQLNDVPGKYAMLPIIEGFETADEGETAGIQSMTFGDKFTLIASSRAADDRQALVHFFRIPPAGSIDAADAQSTIQVAPAGEALNPEILALQFIDQKLFAAGRAPAMRGFLCELMWDEAGDTGCSLITKRSGDVNRPTAIIPGVRGQMLVANMGEPTDQTDSTILIYDPQSGRSLASVATGLYDLVALAVSPTSGRLYGLDLADGASTAGGLYRLDLKNEDGEMVCRPSRMMTLNRPMAMAFRPDGELMIVTLGTHTREFEGGLLVRIYNDSEL